MGKDWRYLAYLSLLVALVLVLFFSKNKQYDWSVTLAHEDKNPYGTYALHALLPSLFPGRIKLGNKTFYELKDSLSPHDGALFLATSFNPDREDARGMLEFVARGGHLFVATDHVQGLLADTLGLRTRDVFFSERSSLTDHLPDSAAVQITNPHLDTTQRYYFKRANVANFFSPADTSDHKHPPVVAAVVAKNDRNLPVAIKVSWGTGYFLFCSTPLAFTNIYLLNRNNNKLASSLLTNLPVRQLYWTEYYQRGRLEATTPLRFILITPPLRWAYYLTAVAILLFVVFEAKRRQRPIPVVTPLANTTLEFVSTVSNLFYERSDHKGIATKKIAFFLDAVRDRLNFHVPLHAPDFVSGLAKKAGVDEANVRKLVQAFEHIGARNEIDADELIQLNHLIKTFWNTKSRN